MTDKPERTPAQQRAHDRFAPRPGQYIPTINLDADPDNAYWLKAWGDDATFAPDSPEGLAWALGRGWTKEGWAGSVKRAQWQREWESQQAKQGGTN